MRLKTPPQPLVFCFDGATALCGAVAEIYRIQPKTPSALCLWRGKYILQVSSGLLERRRLAQAVCRYGECLGASPVFYAFCQEHGEEISGDAVSQLGKALSKYGENQRNPEK
ncbi:hypothetical protein D7X94_16985 [Acutalibacter sp. 1XD8-33]|uniref:hypothetical protein n=1 Tax=Acutalibacter sp. 1XD8-33 TaxID=2320081 RepID=UPI000EA401AE|nr:hypothetical protein [Acutalibacter sp. 1XD8-33]RKJ38273.1 hypothetical protein D7X94_16985 [Acutalibacter sp. 1XD8-33]